jgi:DNA-binding NarL/FixJ family response regulator
MTIKLLVGCREEQAAQAICSRIVHAAPGPIAGEAADIDGVLRAAAATPPDVLLLQYAHSLDETTRNGAWQVLSRISGVSANTRVLLLCDTYTPRSIVGFIQHGASGCVLSSCEPPLLAKAVRTVHEGETWFGRTDLLQALRSQLDANPVIASDVLEDQELLTSREREILGLIGTAMTNKEIARQLKISDHTVKTHLHHIYVKLEKSGRYKAFLSNAISAPLPPQPTPLGFQQGGFAAD